MHFFGTTGIICEISKLNRCIPINLHSALQFICSRQTSSEEKIAKKWTCTAKIVPSCHEKMKSVVFLFCPLSFIESYHVLVDVLSPCISNDEIFLEYTLSPNICSEDNHMTECKYKVKGITDQADLG